MALTAQTANKATSMSRIDYNEKYFKVGYLDTGN